MRNGICGFLVVAFLLLLAGTAPAQEAGEKWGIGTFLDYNRSMFKLKDWYKGGRGEVGVVFTYVASDRVSVELEYHRSKFDNGSLESLPFTWSVDGKDYVSPNAISKMRINNFLVNAVVRRGGSGMLNKGNYSPYLTVGAGFYDYTTDVRGLIYPKQLTAPLDQTRQLEPFSDTRTALGANVGFGVEGFISDNISVDLRGRYNVLMGELRPMEAWGLEGQTFPMQFWNLRGGMRFYFKR
jgi:opacity protein-like surface antigen